MFPIIQIMRRSIFMPALAVAALASCNRIDTPEMGSNALDISVRNGMGTKAVVEGTTLPDGSSIGLFVTDESGKTYDGNTVANVKYTATGEGDAQKWNAASDVLLSTTVANVSSYYPYDESVTDITSIPIEVTSDVQKDWMWGTPVSGLDNNNTSATITMSHALAVVRLNIIKGSFAGTGNIDYVSIKSDAAATSAVMDATTGTLTNVNRAGYTFISTNEFTLDTGGTVVDFIVVPTNTEAPLDIKVFVNGSEMVATTTGVTLESGKIYEYTVSVGVEALLLNKLNISEWLEQEVQEQASKPFAPTIRYIGTKDNIKIIQSVTSEGIIVTASPILDGYQVNEVSVNGSAYKQSVDENGVRTIIISDIFSDIAVVFEGTTFVPWARIQHVDGTLYTAEEWLAAEAAGTVTDADANGVAIKYSRYTSCPHIIHKKATSGYWGRLGILQTIPITSENYIYYDIDGKTYTDEIVRNYQNYENIAAVNCANTIFPNGQQGYMPAIGQVIAWMNNFSIINKCLNAIGGSEFTTSSRRLNSSSQKSDNLSWSVYYSTSKEGNAYLQNENKEISNETRAVCSFIEGV